MSNFANRLRNLRKQRNLRQKDIADALGITESAYGQYEQGKREPKLDALIQIADYFTVTLDFLLGHDLTESHNTLIDEFANSTGQEQRIMLTIRDALRVGHRPE